MPNRRNFLKGILGAAVAAPAALATAQGVEAAPQPDPALFLETVYVGSGSVPMPAHLSIAPDDAGYSITQVRSQQRLPWTNVWSKTFTITQTPE